jgi:hypothetical protein
MHVARHCALWHLPSPANDNGLTLIRRIDEPFTAWPFLGSRRMTAMLRAEGHADSSFCVCALEGALWPAGDLQHRGQPIHQRRLHRGC